MGDSVLVMMIQVGEEMGELSQSLEKACRVFERELRERMKVITTALEPMMLPIMELDLA